MSWSKLAPIAKITGRPMASASIVVNKSGDPKIALILAATLHGDYGEQTRCDVSAGGGEHAGSLLIEFIPGGDFEIKLFGKGGGRLFIPLQPGMPRAARPNLPCKLGDRTATSLIVQLPMAGWANAFPSPVGVVRAGDLPPAVETKPAAPATAADDRLDVVEYLSGKGLSVKRLAAGRFMLSGENVTLSGMLKQVNQIRANADLDPLPLAKVR